MSKRDYYEVLGVERSASDAEIKRAFRKLAQQWHPDVNTDPAAQERFKEINEAYQVLSDPDRRQRYDMFGRAGVDGGAAGPSGFEGFGGFSDIFDAFFGGGAASAARRGRPQPGADLRYDLEIIPLDETDNPLFPANDKNYPVDKNNFSPRVGFSHSLDDAGKMVVRAGYGRFYNRTILGAIDDTMEFGKYTASNVVQFPANAADPGPAAGRLPTDPMLVNGPVVNRAALAGRIRESLTPAEAWSAEVKIRLDEVNSGAVRPVPWDEARRLILADDDAAG